MYFPPIPTKISLHGDISKAQQYITLGRKVLFELKRDLSWTDWNSSPTGQRIRLLDDGTRINVQFSYNLSSIEIITVVKVKKREVKKPCDCCIDCLLVGRITSDTTIFEDTRFANIAMCQTDSMYIAFEGIPITDANTNLKTGDLVIVYATPALQYTGDLEVTTNLRTVQDYRKGKIWQFYNCMLSDNAASTEEDLSDLGLNNQVLTVTGDVCNAAGKSIAIDEEDPPTKYPLRFFITSIKAGACLRL